ncbi:hypothetical protein D9756_000054 [Leucocoprinus leucothites]|uniref:Uncharacterized protein n=1 Tax=Leucocoprinus leucothites TaxID=201217 RepID=A0A8H5GED5_9AGAR|nr:hypothetical protein D9756_000054 [Leucoagaricus leucothites]
MPFTYHYRNRSSSSVDDLLASPQEPLIDDSIVLSDLIRIGETSRLRRRGAMRIEPTGITSSRHRWRSPINPQGADDTSHGDSLGYNWPVFENRSRHIPRHLPMLEVSDDDLEDSDSDSGDEMVFSASFNRAISEQTGNPIVSEVASLRSRSSAESVSEKPSLDSGPYTLVCGGGIGDTVFNTRTDPESVYSALASFILPQPPTPQWASSPQRPSPEMNDANGCGTVIHTRAFPRYRHHQPMWTANSPASDVVVPLERSYFDEICAKEKLSPKIIKQEACGCLRIGIGCANCGNQLGFRLTPCKTLREHISLRQSRLRQRQRHASSSTSTTPDPSEDANFYLYTFFCSSTTSPETPVFPAAEPPARRRHSRPRTYPLLPPPPPLIRLMSDSEMSDSDEEVNIDFRTPGTSSTHQRILDGDVTASPEPTVIRLERNSPMPGQEHSREASSGHFSDAEYDTELGQARASWANVVRGVEATASSLATNMEGHPSRYPSGRPRRRRDALGLDPERELGLTPPSTWRSEEGTSNSHSSDIPSVLFEQSAVSLTPPPPELRDLPPDIDDFSNSDQNTPRPTVWDVSFADPDESPSTSFWGRPRPGSAQWTWSNELAQFEGERERRRERESVPARVFDPDGEFLEGLEGEWDEDMARRLGFSSTEEKSEGNDTTTALDGSWWS